MELQPLTGNTAPRARAVAADKATQALAEPRPTATEARAPEPAAPPAPPEPSAEQLSQAIKNINFALHARSQDLEFSVDSESDRLVVTVTDTDTKEVIRQMPSKEAMEIAKALGHLQSLLIRQTA